jgi:hypothetical protein
MLPIVDMQHVVAAIDDQSCHFGDGAVGGRGESYRPQLAASPLSGTLAIGVDFSKNCHRDVPKSPGARQRAIPIASCTGKLQAAPVEARRAGYRWASSPQNLLDQVFTVYGLKNLMK